MSAICKQGHVCGIPYSKAAIESRLARATRWAVSGFLGCMFPLLATAQSAPFNPRTCVQGDAARQNFYKRCEAHTGCKIVAFRLMHCVNANWFLESLGKVTAGRDEIRNDDIFEALLPPPSRSAWMAYYAAEAKLAAHSESTDPLFSRVASNETQVGGRNGFKMPYDYFEGRAIVRTQPKGQQQHRLRVGRGVLIDVNGFVTRGEFRDGKSHGVVQIIRLPTTYEMPPTKVDPVTVEAGIVQLHKWASGVRAQQSGNPGSYVETLLTQADVQHLPFFHTPFSQNEKSLTIMGRGQHIQYHFLPPRFSPIPAPPKTAATAAQEPALVGMAARS